MRQDNPFRKLYRGQYPLVLTFWGFYVIGIFACVMLAGLAVFPLLLFHAFGSALIVFFVILSSYVLLATVGTWRSANAYNFDRRWAIMAKALVGLAIADAIWQLVDGGAATIVSAIMD